MIGLMTSADSPARRAKASEDDANQRASSVRTSRRTLLSTSVSATGEREDFVRAQAGRGLSLQPRDDVRAPSPALPHLPDDNRAAPRLERHLGVRQQAEPLAEPDGDRDLALGRDLHGHHLEVRILPCILLLRRRASCGDLLPWMFRQFKVGTLVGQRTWGGLVGILCFRLLTGPFSAPRSF